MLSSFTLGGLLHILLLVAIVAAIMNLLRGRRVV
jgi:hypothetical protein